MGKAKGREGEGLFLMISSLIGFWVDFRKSRCVFFVFEI